jgi:hypothetical protein
MKEGVMIKKEDIRSNWKEEEEKCEGGGKQRVDVTD